MSCEGVVVGCRSKCGLGERAAPSSTRHYMVGYNYQKGWTKGPKARAHTHTYTHTTRFTRAPISIFIFYIQKKERAVCVCVRRLTPTTKNVDTIRSRHSAGGLIYRNTILHHHKIDTSEQHIPGLRKTQCTIERSSQKKRDSEKNENIQMKSMAI